MSIEALNWAIKQPIYPPATKLILIVLANYCDEKGSCYPSVSTLASICGVSGRQVRRCLSALQQSKMIRTEPRIMRGGQTSNRYFLRVDVDDRGVGHQSHPLPDMDVTPPLTPMTDHEPKDEPKDKPKETYTSDFNAFWKIYPRKTAKFAAGKAYAKAVKSVSPKKLLSITMAFAVNNSHTEMKFIPHASTWLNQKRYLDEPVPRRTANNLAG